MNIWKINQYIRQGELPLHVAVELSAPGVLVEIWRTMGMSENGKREMLALLVFTRWRELWDALPKLSAEAMADGRFQALERDVSWSDAVAADRVLTAVSEIAAQAGGCPDRPGSRRNALLRSTDPSCVAAEKAVWKAVRDIGPPTLEEIVAAAECHRENR